MVVVPRTATTRTKPRTVAHTLPLVTTVHIVTASSYLEDIRARSFTVLIEYLRRIVDPLSDYRARSPSSQLRFFTVANLSEQVRWASPTPGKKMGTEWSGTTHRERFGTER